MCSSCFDFNKIINHINFEKTLCGKDNVMFLPLKSTSTYEIFSLILFFKDHLIGKKIYYDKVYNELHFLDYRLYLKNICISYEQKILIGKIKFVKMKKIEINEKEFIDFFKVIDE